MLTIRTATVADAGLLMNFIRGLAEYEKGLEKVRTTEGDIARLGFGDNPQFRALIAEWSGAPAAYAIFFDYFSTWRGAGFYLEDLFVRQEYRGKGIGRAMLKHVAGIASLENRGFIRWEVIDWNEPAIKFYESLGAEFLDEWRAVIFSRNNFANLDAR